MDSAANRDGAQPTCRIGSGDPNYRQEDKGGGLTVQEYDRDHGIEAEQAKRIADDEQVRAAS